MGRLAADTIKPQFICGDTLLNKYIELNTKYPDEARNNCMRGKVEIGFKITSSGNIESVTVLKNSFKPLDNEALRVVYSTIGKWKPATVNGIPIDYYLMTPFNFWFDDYQCDNLPSGKKNALLILEIREKEDLLYNAGVAKLHNNDYTNALKDFDAALKIDPLDPDALYNRAICKLNLGDKEGACADLKKAKRWSSSKSPEGISNLLDKYCK